MSNAPLLDSSSSKEEYRDRPSDVESSGDGDYDFVQPRSRNRLRLAIQAVAILVALTAATLCGHYLPQVFGKSSSPSSCPAPAVRYEWRSLSKQEQTNYLDAVDCLRSKPSRLGMSQTLYDDFPYVHSLVGAYSHHSAAFLAWHRYFIHVYEQALQDECGYDGHLTYWDWTLDWEDLTHAPIWSSDTFGSSGDPSVGDELLHGHCVVDGRFAQLEVPLLRFKLNSHCLSRGFITGEDLRSNGSACQPAAMQKLLEEDVYEDFFSGLEDGPHDAIPHTIRGDFLVFTAPADPVFFLHHTQLDRMWGMWQDHDPANRRFQYNGPASDDERDRPASLDDVIPMGGLAPDIRARDVLDTQAGMLCYRY